MPLFTCPNCQRKVRVQDEQLGHTLRCPGCGGRFLADASLPPNVHVENYSGEPPPVQQPADDFAHAAPTATDRAWQAANHFATEWPVPGWGLFWLSFMVEFALGFMLGFAWQSHHWFRRPLWDSDLFWAVLWLLAFTKAVLQILCLFHVAKLSRNYNENAAGWILVVWLLQSVGLGVYLASRPERSV